MISEFQGLVFSQKSRGSFSILDKQIFHELTVLRMIFQFQTRPLKRKYQIFLTKLLRLKSIYPCMRGIFRNLLICAKLEEPCQRARYNTFIV